MTRICCNDKNDIGYKTFMELGGFSPGWKILLNGKPIDFVNDVFLADEELGKICYFPRNEEGKHIIDKVDKKIVYKIVEGKVEIFPPLKLSSGAVGAIGNGEAASQSARGAIEKIAAPNVNSAVDTNSFVTPAQDGC